MRLKTKSMNPHRNELVRNVYFGGLCSQFDTLTAFCVSFHQLWAVGSHRAWLDSVPCWRLQEELEAWSAFISVLSRVHLSQLHTPLLAALSLTQVFLFHFIFSSMAFFFFLPSSCRNSIAFEENFCPFCYPSKLSQCCTSVELAPCSVLYVNPTSGCSIHKLWMLL